MTCDEDPHCIKIDGQCKLYIHRTNLFDEKRDNEIFYMDRVVEELLRYPIKRNEILYDSISPIINKELIVLKPSVYIIVHHETPDELKQMIQMLYMNKVGIQLNTRPLYNTYETTEVTFPREQYMKTTDYVLLNSFISSLPKIWENYLSKDFKEQSNPQQSLYQSLVLGLNQMDLNENITIQVLKEKIIQSFEMLVQQKLVIKKIIEIFQSKIYIQNQMSSQNENQSQKDKKKKKSKTNQTQNQNQNKTQSSKMNMPNINMNMRNNETQDLIVQLYKNYCQKVFKHIQSLESLKNEILHDKNLGCEVDIIIVSMIFQINIVILERVRREGEIGYVCIGPQFGNFSKYILLIKNTSTERNLYSIVVNQNKYLFDEEELPFSFRSDILSQCDRHLHICYDC
jgi:hypothetical protein